MDQNRTFKANPLKLKKQLQASDQKILKKEKKYDALKIITILKVKVEESYLR